jgi:hypothetical protein
MARVADLAVVATIWRRLPLSIAALLAPLCKGNGPGSYSGQVASSKREAFRAITKRRDVL